MRENPNYAQITNDPHRRVFTYLWRWCAWKRWWQVALIVFVLYLPAFGMGQVMDDYHFETALRRHSELSVDLLLNAFNFGERRDTAGVSFRNIPWWGDPEYRMRFLRPLAAFTLWLDYHLLALPARHAHSLLWYGFLLWGLAGFYRRALQPRAPSTDAAFAQPDRIAFLAWLLFAVNDAHALPVAWVAHRSLIIAVAFAVWALRSFEMNLRGTGSRWSGPLFFTLALCGGEAALGILAYMGLRVLIVPIETSANDDSNRVARLAPLVRVARLAPLVPYAVIALVYLTLYSAGGFGTYASGLYLNPMREPLAFAAQFIKSWPILVGGLLGPISAGWYGLAQVFPIVLWIIVPAGLLVFALCCYYLRPFGDPIGAFLFGGALLALLPACMAAPADRLLMIAGIGAYPLIARFLFTGRGWFWWALLVGHLFVSGLNVSGSVQFFADYAAYAREKIAGLKRITPATRTSGESRAVRKVVLLNAPGICLGLQFPHLYGANIDDLDADNFLLIANNLSPVSVTRIDRRTLEVVTEYPGLSASRVFARPNNHLKPNRAFQKTFASVEVMKLNSAGWPSIVRFRFDVPLDEIAFIAIWGDDYRYVTPPPIGKTIVIPEPDGKSTRLYL